MNIVDNIEQASTKQAFAMRKRLFEEEGIMSEISSGSSVHTALKVAEEIDTSKTLVTIIHDTGECYLRQLVPHPLNN